MYVSLVSEYMEREIDVGYVPVSQLRTYRIYKTTTPTPISSSPIYMYIQGYNVDSLLAEMTSLVYKLGKIFFAFLDARE